MNAQTIIQELDTLDRIQKQIFMAYAKMFDDNAPRSFYMNHYELADGQTPRYDGDPKAYPGHPNTKPEMWERFLDIPEIYRYTNSKIAKLAESDAKKALQSLGQNSESVPALKELIKSSKALQGGKQQQTIIMSYVSPKVRAK